MNVIEEKLILLDKQTQETIKYFESLTTEQAQWKKDHSSWKIAEIIIHITLVEDNICKMLNSVYQNKTLPSPKQTSMNFEKVLQIMSSREHKAESPEMFMPNKPHFDMQQDIDLFKNNRHAIKTFYNKADINKLEILTFDHRRLGTLNLLGWLALLIGHCKRHIEQIHEIIELHQ